MELINNVSKTLRYDLMQQLQPGSRLSIAASCFSIYAFQELKEALKDIKELRFIFTSPTFTTEKTPQTATGILYTTLGQRAHALWL